MIIILLLIALVVFGAGPQWDWAPLKAWYYFIVDKIRSWW